MEVMLVVVMDDAGADGGGRGSDGLFPGTYTLTSATDVLWHGKLWWDILGPRTDGRRRLWDIRPFMWWPMVMWMPTPAVGLTNPPPPPRVRNGS